ncbi:formyl transferase [Brumimicrobium oceani]|uniref:Formyl transferase n=2 Tax=Brumimicrobium oceani TaxID=2100725 RepID=A0A2U2XF26_9FLAO|nr:formyl transferase [Brumimicrobium oceani]
MKILFIGTVDFSYSCLEHLIENNFKICGVITKRKSNFNSDFSDLTPLCNKFNIPTYFDEKSNNETKEEFISNQKPDIIYCFGWSYLLPTSILNATKHGVIGFHPSLLPNNRGRHPIIWALFLGLKKTGSSFFIMDKDADTGDIISQKVIKVSPQDTATTLYDEIKCIALNQIIDFSNHYQNKGEAPLRIKQNKNQGNSWRKRGKLDGIIDFRMNSLSIFNLVRALTHPYVGAHIEIENKEIKIWEVSISKVDYPINYEPGKVLDIIDNTKIVVKTYDSAIILEKHEFTELPKINEYL